MDKIKILFTRPAPRFGTPKIGIGVTTFPQWSGKLLHALAIRALSAYRHAGVELRVIFALLAMLIEHLYHLHADVSLLLLCQPHHLLCWRTSTGARTQGRGGIALPRLATGTRPVLVLGNGNVLYCDWAGFSFVLQRRFEAFAADCNFLFFPFQHGHFIPIPAPAMKLDFLRQAGFPV